MIKTKFGNATKDNTNYYRICSHKEGNYGKLLHRLIFEDYYQISLLDGVVIHHKDENRLNNEISNLTAMTRSNHISFHKKGNQDAKGCIRNNKTRRKMSIHQNTTGYRNVSTNKGAYKQGFCYRYSYYEDGKQKAIRSVDIQKLKEKVLAKGLIWEEYTQNEKNVTMEE